MKVGNFEFGRENIERIWEVETICRLAQKVFPEPFKHFIKYIHIFVYVNASFDLINDRDNAIAFEIREAVAKEIADDKLLNVIDKLVNKEL